MLDVLYLAHDVADPAIRRRTLMLEAGGAKVTVAGFRRGAGTPVANGIVELGVTRDGRFGQRIAAIAKATMLLRHKLRGPGGPPSSLPAISKCLPCQPGKRDFRRRRSDRL